MRAFVPQICQFTVTAGPQQWRFINYIIKGFCNLESVCWRTRLYLLGWDIIAFPAGQAWILSRQHFTVLQHCSRKADLAFSTLISLQVRGFLLVEKVEEDAAVSKIKALKVTSSTTSVAAGSTNLAFSLPTNTGVRNTTFAIVHNK